MKYEDSDYKELIGEHHFILEGEPIPNARPRGRCIPRGNTYIPTFYDKLHKEKKQIKSDLLDLYQGKLYNAPKDKYKVQESFFIEMELTFYNKIVKSANKLSQSLASLEVLRNINQKDTDNLIKLYMDCLHDVVYDNDCLVTKVSGEKLFTDIEDNERVEFVIRVYKYNLEVE